MAGLASGLTAALIAVFPSEVARLFRGVDPAVASLVGWLVGTQCLYVGIAAIYGGLRDFGGRSRFLLAYNIAQAIAVCGLSLLGSARGTRLPKVVRGRELDPRGSMARGVRLAPSHTTGMGRCAASPDGRVRIGLVLLASPRPRYGEARHCALELHGFDGSSRRLLGGRGHRRASREHSADRCLRGVPSHLGPRAWGRRSHRATAARSRLGRDRRGCRRWIDRKRAGRSTLWAAVRARRSGALDHDPGNGDMGSVPPTCL